MHAMAHLERLLIEIAAIVIAAMLFGWQAGVVVLVVLLLVSAIQRDRPAAPRPPEIPTLDDRVERRD